MMPKFSQCSLVRNNEVAETEKTADEAAFGNRRADGIKKIGDRVTIANLPVLCEWRQFR
jgi:hypothetical protein